MVELDPDCQWAVVGGPSRNYLWVLSRAPSMDRALFDAIRARAAQRGYPVDTLFVAAPLDQVGLRHHADPVVRSELARHQCIGATECVGTGFDGGESVLPSKTRDQVGDHFVAPQPGLAA